MRTEKATRLARARKGDMDAFAEVFEPLREMVYAVAYRLVGPDEAEDVVMQTYLKAWQAIPRFNGRSSLKTWLYRITRNCALDNLRARSRRRDRVVENDDIDESRRAEWSDPAQSTPADAMVRDETVMLMQEALRLITPEHRTTLELRYADGLSYAEIAAATGVSIGTVMSRIFNGKRKLRVVLEGGNRS